MNRLTKILIGFVLVLVVAVVGVGLWTVFFQPLSQPSGETATNGSGVPVGGLAGSGNANGGGTNLPTGAGTLPGTTSQPGGNANTNGAVAQPGQVAAPTASFRLLSQQPVVNPILAANGQDLRYYDSATGKFMVRRSDGVVVALSDRRFHQVSAVTWSPDRTRALLEYPDGANIIYDFKRDRQVTIPTHWEAFSFSPRGDAIVAKSIGSDPSNISLVTADAEGTSLRVISSLGDKADQVIAAWSPADTAVAMLVEHSDDQRQEIFFFGKNDENYKSITVEGWGFNGQWTPTGDRLLYSTYRRENGERPQLAVIDAGVNSAGRNRVDLQLQTWVDKCTFADNSTAYCAVPRSLPEGAGLFTDAYDQTADDLYRINLNTGSTSLIASPQEGRSMQNLQVSVDGRAVYFTDAADGRLYQIDF